MVNVKLLNYTKNGIEFVANSARVSGVGMFPCECKKDPGCVKCGGQGLREPMDMEIVSMILINDYSSALEYINFTLEISGLSKGNAAELLEHRIASHTGRSTRYNEESEFDWVIPPAIEDILEKYGIGIEEFKEKVNDKEAFKDFIYGLEDKVPEESLKAMKIVGSSIRKSKKSYRKLLDLGMGKESARYVTPFAMHTAYIYKINLRSLINFLGLRLCVRASPEMRDMASKMYKIGMETYPEIFRHLWCRGFTLGACPENMVRNSPQGKECPFKTKGSPVYIPTKDELRGKLDMAAFDKVRDGLLSRWK